MRRSIIALLAALLVGVCIMLLVAQVTRQGPPVRSTNLEQEFQKARALMSPLRPLEPRQEMLTPEYGHPSEAPAPVNIKITPRPCQPLTLEAARERNQGYTLANALLWMLASTNIGQRQSAYRLLDEVSEYINLHGAEDFDVYDYVFCGAPWEIVARNILHDAFGNPHMPGRYRLLARGAVSHFELTEALPLIEKRLAESTDELEIIQLAERWLNLKIGSTWQAEATKKRAAELLAELVRKLPRLKEFPVAARAIAFYGELLKNDGCLCPPQDMIGFQLEGAPPPPAPVQEKLFFLDPETECPPPATLQEMKLQQCPFQSS